MSHPIPVGHYSQLGNSAISNIASSDGEYVKFMKYFGRVFKHPVSVALEFYVNRPDAQFIASEAQWLNANYHVEAGREGIDFLNQKGAVTTLYDFEDVHEEYPPKRWAITQNNVSAVKSELNITSDKPLFVALDEMSSAPSDDLSLIQDLGLTGISDGDKIRFRDSYHNMIQLMIAGRLEINGARYTIQPDRAALEICQNNEQRFVILTNAASAARKSLNSVEYAFDSLRTQNAIARKEREENEIQRMEESKSRAENGNAGVRVSSDSEGRAEERDNEVRTGDQGRSDRMGSDSGDRREPEEGRVVSGDENEDNNGRGDISGDAVSSESSERPVRTDNGERALNGGGADRSVRKAVDEEHGEELSGEGGVYAVHEKLSDGSQISGSEGGEILRTAERAVRHEQSPSSDVRGDSEMGKGEEVRVGSLSIDGDSTRAGDNSLTVDTNINEEKLNELISRVSAYKEVVNAVVNSDRPTAIIEIAHGLKKDLPYMLEKDITGNAEFYNAVTARLDSDEAFREELCSRIYDTVVADFSPVDSYRAGLPDTRFTKLSEQQRFNYEYQHYVDDPETSIWGEIDSRYRINNGIYEVRTPSHGGIMIESKAARTVLSREAQKVAQKEKGWYYFEEDCDYAVAMRELIDKGLFRDIDDYYRSVYSKNTAEIFPKLNEIIEIALLSYNEAYHDARESAMFNALTPEEQAEEVGQLLFDAEGDETNVPEIRKHEIEKAIADVERRIERLETSAGDPEELITQRNMLNFLQAAIEKDLEITPDSFKQYIAENTVDTNINGVSASTENTFEIYQLKDVPEMRYLRFTDYETLHREGNSVKAENYDKVYEDKLADGTTLEDIYTRFNIDHPDDFTGHSLSVSDIIVVHSDGDTTAYYVDSIGYKAVPEFLQNEMSQVEAPVVDAPPAAAKDSNTERAIHEGFAEVSGKRKYTEKQQQFIDRLEKYAANNGVTENIIDSAFENAPAFHNTYGNRQYVSKNIFQLRLGSIEKEIEAAIKAAQAKTEDKGSITINKAGDFWEIYGKDARAVADMLGLHLSRKNNDDMCGFPNENREEYSQKLRDAGYTILIAETFELTGQVQTQINEPVFETALDKAKHLINEFCETEYREGAEFSDLHHVSLAYTTLSDDELPVQVEADLIDHRITYTFDGEVFNTEQYSSIEDMAENGLTGLDFMELVYVPEEIVNKHISSDREEQNKPLYMTLSRCKQDCEYAINSFYADTTLSSLNKKLYGGSVDACIGTMREKYALLSAEEKPEWLSAEDIDSYEEQLRGLLEQIERNSKPVVLASIQYNGEQTFLKIDGRSVEDLLSYANNYAPVKAISSVGISISEQEYAEIQQSDKFGVSVDFDLNEGTAEIYSVNNGKGGISEANRTDNDISIQTVSIADYSKAAGLGKEKVSVSAADAISMWDNGFPVYFNDEIVLQRKELPEGTDVTELFSDDKVFAAEFGDVKKQQMIDNISDLISSIDAVMPEDRYIDIREFAEKDDDHIFEWDNGQNVYLNITKALCEYNMEFIDDYLTAVKNEFDSIRGEMAQNALAEYSNYIPPQKECNTVLDLSEYGTIDLKEIDELYLRDTYSYYEGGIDSDGHERKDNYSQHNRSLEITLDAMGSANACTTDTRDIWGDIADQSYDLSDPDEVAELGRKITNFIKNSEDLIVTTTKGEVKQNLPIKSRVDTNINEVEGFTEELNAQTLSDVEEGDILLTRDPSTGESMYFRIDSMQDDFMVSMSRVADETGSPFTDIGIATKGIIDGHWKETLLDENIDFPILRFTKNYQQEVRKAATQEPEISEALPQTVAEVPQKGTSHRKASRANILYNAFSEAFPDIASGEHSYEKYGDYIEGGENDTFEPLSIEHLGDNTYGFMMWYIMNGDLMRDPDFVFTLDHENKELHVWEYQMDGVPGIGTMYQSVELEDGTIDKDLQAALESNFRSVLRDAVNQGRELYAYTNKDGETIEVRSSESTDHVEEPVIDDPSAYYRATLNAFSEKHGLGELNITNANNGFHIMETFADGESLPISFISSHKSTPLTNEEVEEQLNFIEKLAESNETTVAEFNSRMNSVNAHGGISELPPVQDNLPELIYADNPDAKAANNLAAINELHRIEKKLEEGEYPFDENRNSWDSYESSMERLRRYSGWGGIPQIFDDTFPSLRYYRERLHEALTPEEWDSARRSTLTSFYTEQTVIDAMYKTIQNMGISENSRVLEPACGTGNFISRMPHNIGNGGVVGVELDPITARIAKYLHTHIPNPDSKKEEEAAKIEAFRDVKILNCGFERSGLEDNSFDLVIGNVPFGDFKLSDPDYTKDWLIHDAFFRKALDKVAPGGVVAFITSSGTMDKKNPKIREYLATYSDLIGAVRLPNNAFSTAGTPVTSDIIFLQKRQEPLNVYDPKPDWCYTAPVEVETVGKDPEMKTAYINAYFVNNPQMILGTMKQTSHFDMLTCEPKEDESLKSQLDTAFRQLNAKINIRKREQSVLERRGYIQPWGKTFTYQVKDDKVFFNMGNSMEEITGDKKKISQLKALCELRDTIRELLERQQQETLDCNLVLLRNKLNEQYDSFVKTYNTLTSRAVKSLFKQDADYPILAALERIDPETNKVTKSDIFTRRTVNPIAEVSAADSVEEAMQISLDKRGKIDIPYMATLLTEHFNNAAFTDVMKYTAEELLAKELVFKDPEGVIPDVPYAEIVDKSAYLCGNVRRKLSMAKEAAKTDSSYERNVAELTEVLPETVGATEIAVDLGCTWIDTEDYEEFMRSLSGRSKFSSRFFGVRFSEITGKYTVDNARMRSTETLNVNEISTYGTEDMNMYLILDNLLNQKKIQVFDTIPDPSDPSKKKSVINKNKTQVAQAKAKAIKEAFSNWIFATDERKEKYVKRYNNMFNNIVGRTYDGSHLTFNGMANDFKLRPHQLDCVARTIYGGNTLVAHCVGAGKSAVIASSVMKKKELSLINKACVVVPKPLTEQTEREWRTSFPDAKLLVVDNKDLGDEKKRKLFTARVATGDYDAVIMSQEQFEKLSMSKEHQLEYLRKQCSVMRDDLIQRKRDTGRKDPSIKELERAIVKLEEKIGNITNPKSKQKAKDNLLDFETLGFDYLVVDEAHAYKNGYVSTKMGDVSGINTKESGRSADMQMKCDYINSEFGNGHILFATGTPVSNSMTELYVMTRYLRPDLLESCGCARFDDWAATFGQIKTQNKKTATGELKLKTCFAGFKNRPELIAMYKEFADLKSLDKLDYLNPPKIKGGKPQIVEVEATPEQRAIVKDFAKRGKAIQLGLVRPDQDNLLKITGEARLVGLGNLAVKSVYDKNDWDTPDGFVADDKSGKIDKCVEIVSGIYHDRYDDKAVQIIFSDIAVNSDDGKFSAYEYIRNELINNGVKPEEIVFAPKSEAKNRADIFRDINEAKYRIVIASTGTLGTGANIQKNLYALHHLDIPWRPSDFQQREGRIVRQGNLNEEVEIFNYVTKGTLDSYLYQGVTDKARGIAQLWNDSNISRTSEDIDEKVLTFGELEAAAEGNPKLREYSELKNRIDELKVLCSEYNRETTRLESSLKDLPFNIEMKKSLVRTGEADIKSVEAMKTNGRVESFSIITDSGKKLTEKTDMNDYIKNKVQQRIDRPFDTNPPFRVGNFTLSVEASLDRMHPVVVVKGERNAAYRFEAGVSENADNFRRIANFLETGISGQVEKDKQSLDKLTKDMEQAQKRIEAPSPHDAELKESMERFEALEKELALGGYLDIGEEFAGADDYSEYETERMELRPGYDDNDMSPEEYSCMI